MELSVGLVLGVGGGGWERGGGTALLPRTYTSQTQFA